MAFVLLKTDNKYKYMCEKKTGLVIRLFKGLSMADDVKGDYSMTEFVGEYKNKQIILSDNALLKAYAKKLGVWIEDEEQSGSESETDDEDSEADSEEEEGITFCDD